MITHIIHKSHNSPFKTRITDYDGSHYLSRMATITRVALKYTVDNVSQYADSDAIGQEDVFDWATLAASSEMLIDIGLLDFTAGRDQEAELIIYDSTYPEGRVQDPKLDLEVNEDALGAAALTDPVTSISLDDIQDIDTSGGTTGDVLTQQSDGSFAMETPGSVSIDETLADDLSYSGPTSTITVGENVVFGNFLYKKLSDGKYYKAQADSVLTAPGTRMALATALADATCLVLRPGGIARNDAWSWTADGSVLGLYLSSVVAGNLTESLEDPMPLNSVAQIVAIPTASNTIEFLPSLIIMRR